MRLFQIKIQPIEMYTWARDNEEYKVSYAKNIAEADALAAERTKVLERLNLSIIDLEDLTRAPVVVTASQLIDLNMSTVKYNVVRELRPGRDDEFDPTDFLAEFRVLAEKLLAAPLLENQGVHKAYNQKCEVHMPGQALSVYNELMLAEDSCTDALQRSLDDGWRIIAAMPQSDQRRPDYILGRFNPDRQIGDSQARRQ